MAKPVVEVDTLVKQYGQLRAVDGISFKVHEEEVFAFLGPNGAGKTTTVEILECIRPLTSGTARIFGYEVTRNSDVVEIKRRIGALPQEFSALDKLTVKENIELIGDMYEKHLDVMEIIKLLDLEDKTNEKFENLSGGLKQRVGVAAALVSDPQLIFLDEPTTGLDPKARRDVWAVITNLKKLGKTVFLTTHYMEEAQMLADRVAIINKGKIAAIGSPQELIAQYGGLKILKIRGGDEALAGLLQKKYDKVSLNSNGDILVKIDDAEEFWRVMATLTDMKVGRDIEIQTPTIEDVFLKITGGIITEEGELKQ
ncbi:ATP-binding cassette domain-containing protein [Candidatus Bathyarchaeota archaeon A05DMB-2]|jgi:ABC-2 type transport system ATP-binding protein|nr:ATP-binding cassette domain-containing protein [Candidatus Bathyarchaeota archaeon A05DMB-2]